MNDSFWVADRRRVNVFTVRRFGYVVPVGRRSIDAYRAYWPGGIWSSAKRRRFVVILGPGSRASTPRSSSSGRWRAIRAWKCCSSTRRTSFSSRRCCTRSRRAPGSPSIVVPIRETLRRVEFLQAQTTTVDFAARTVTVAYGPDRRARTIVFDHLLVAAGSRTRFPPGLRPQVHGMKTIQDALVLRDWLIALLERAEIEDDPAAAAGVAHDRGRGGSGSRGWRRSGPSTTSCARSRRHYRKASDRDRRGCVVIEPNDRLLPEFEPALGDYTASRGCATRASRCACARRWRLSTGGASSSHAVRRFAGNPSPLHGAHADLDRRRRALAADRSAGACRRSAAASWSTRRMAVPGHEGAWACGDCARPCPGASGKPCPHHRAACDAAGRAGGPQHRGDRAWTASQIRPFRYTMIGQFAAIGRQRAVATLFGTKFSGFIAWLMWRGAYLSMLPRLDRKVRVFLQWMLEICFARDTVQLLTVESMYHGDDGAGLSRASAPRLRDRDHRAQGPDRPFRFAGRDRALRRRRRAVAHRRQRHRARGDVPAARRGRAQSARAVPDLAQPAGAQQDGRRRTSRCSGPRTFRAACVDDARRRATEVAVVAGRLGRRDRRRPLPPPPDSWAAQRRCRRRDLDDAHGARRALDAAAPPAARTRAARCTSSGRHALRVGGRSASTRHAGDRAARRRRGGAGQRRRRRGRVPAAAGPPDRRAGRAVRPVRDEHAGRDRAGACRLPPHAVRRLALARATRRCTAETRPLRAPDAEAGHAVRRGHLLRQQCRGGGASPVQGQHAEPPHRLAVGEGDSQALVQHPVPSRVRHLGQVLECRWTGRAERERHLQRRPSRKL